MDTGQPTNVDDAALLAAVRAGDEKAGARLVERYWPAIFRYCLSYLSDEGLAEDVAQPAVELTQCDLEPEQLFERGQKLHASSSHIVHGDWSRTMHSGCQPARSRSRPWQLGSA